MMGDRDLPPIVCGRSQRLLVLTLDQRDTQAAPHQRANKTKSDRAGPDHNDIKRHQRLRSYCVTRQDYAQVGSSSLTWIKSVRLRCQSLNDRVGTGARVWWPQKLIELLIATRPGFPSAWRSRNPQGFDRKSGISGVCCAADVASNQTDRRPLRAILALMLRNHRLRA